jgi:multidrug efflux pump
MLVSGMIIGTVFTLFVVPSIYVLVAKTHHTITDEIEEEQPMISETEPENAIA